MIQALCAWEFAVLLKHFFVEWVMVHLLLSSSMVSRQLRVGDMAASSAAIARGTARSAQMRGRQAKQWHLGGCQAPRGAECLFPFPSARLAISVWRLQCVLRSMKAGLVNALICYGLRFSSWDLQVLGPGAFVGLCSPLCCRRRWLTATSGGVRRG